MPERSQQADVAHPLADQHDQGRGDVEGGDQHDQPEHDEEGHLLQLERGEQLAVELPPVGDQEVRLEDRGRRLGDARRLAGSATVSSSRSTAVSPPHQALHQRTVEQHPAAVELGEAGREGAGDAQALVVEARPPLRETEGDQAQDVPLPGLQPGREIGCPGRRRGCRRPACRSAPAWPRAGRRPGRCRAAPPPAPAARCGLPSDPWP